MALRQCCVVAVTDRARDLKTRAHTVQLHPRMLTRSSSASSRSPRSRAAANTARPRLVGSYRPEERRLNERQSCGREEGGMRMLWAVDGEAQGQSVRQCTKCAASPAACRPSCRLPPTRRCCLPLRSPGPSAGSASQGGLGRCSQASASSTARKSSSGIRTSCKVVKGEECRHFTVVNRGVNAERCKGLQQRTAAARHTRSCLSCREISSAARTPRSPASLLMPRDCFLTPGGARAAKASRQRTKRARSPFVRTLHPATASSSAARRPAGRSGGCAEMRSKPSSGPLSACSNRDARGSCKRPGGEAARRRGPGGGRTAGQGQGEWAVGGHWTCRPRQHLSCPVGSPRIRRTHLRRPGPAAWMPPHPQGC